MKHLKGKVALITGASRGIGKEIALQLAGRGVNLAVNSRSQESLEKVHHELSKSGVDVLLCPGDLADASVPKSIIDTVVNRFGGLDILINNAGLSSSSAELSATPTAAWDLIMNVNARAPFLLCREAIPHLKVSSAGTIINITSTLATKGYVNSGAYTASKHALRGMSKVLAKEVFEDNIWVHVVAPGGVKTDMLDTSHPRFRNRRLSTPDEIANVVLFLLQQRGGGMVIDEIKTHRCSKEPWQ